MLRKDGYHTFNMLGEHHSYQIYVSVPELTAPNEGFPVLYVLDGNAYFTMFLEMMKLQIRRPDKTGIKPMVLVGIGYEGNEPFNPLRVYDFTPPAPIVHLPKKPNGEPWPEHGGADSFLRFLEKKLKPAIENICAIHKKKQILFGHSLGGLFALYTLFNKTNLFHQYFVCSPSIWWNERMILKDEEKMSINESKRIFIAAENNEEKSFMYDDAFALYNDLSSNYTFLKSAFISPREENHMSIVPSVFSRGIRFLSTEF
ncbi:alpha/beta hydrolase [Virgibacillus proomii]|uniref:alpha/beta hydrolase n=1 Tax=Virgibacillus proomii TaxID=84407 RepID=UPI001C11A5D9|nr:alpha/beta hydrolase-fold protein [Virgibacillus proomii]MBU5266720.1 alpha/beta hydrolase [Virgibacillus proomii]